MDKEIIEAFQKGNPDGFKKLYERYSEFAIRNAYLIVKEHNGVKDAVQEAFVRVYRNLHKFDSSKPFKPWFYRILVNECYRYLEKNGRVTPVEQEIAEMNASEEDFSVEFDHQEELEEALHQLDEKYRTVLVLKYLNGFSEQEISDITREERTTVKSRLYKARKRLRSILEGGSE